MNFYILTSKTKIITFLLLCYVLFSSLIYIFFNTLDHNYTDENKFILHKISKCKHFVKLSKNKHPDIVIVGNSRAENHFNSAIFKSHGMNAYTLGVPAISLTDMPYMINKIIAIKPQYVLISIDIMQLYSFPAVKYPTIFDLFYINNSIKSISFMKRLSLNKRLFNIFDFIPIRKYFEDYKKVYFGNSYDSLVNNYSNKFHMKPFCEIFQNYKSATSDRVLSVCKNGNGIVWYNNPTNNMHQTKKLEHLNPYSIALINAMLQDLKKENITPIILLEVGMYNVTFEYNIQAIKKNLNAKIIDTINMKFPRESWADNIHINIKAINEYTTSVYDSLQNIIKN